MFTYDTDEDVDIQFQITAVPEKDRALSVIRDVSQLRLGLRNV